jgi:hypothetical protein
MDEHCGNCGDGPDGDEKPGCEGCSLNHWEPIEMGWCDTCRQNVKGPRSGDHGACRDCRPTGWAAKGEGDEDASS